jgi:acetoin utilization deacetylase AcuC-like enzyme
MRAETITTFYRPEQVVSTRMEESYSKSPLKPKLVVEALLGTAQPACATIEGNFPPFEREQFLLAHTEHYVKDFFTGRAPLCTSNALPWSHELAESVRFTNASLYHAVRHALLFPAQVTLSPTSGFHHAQPSRGAGFCTFSGQVLTSLKLYHEFGVSGAWIDLDAHFGNSIEDSRSFCPALDNAVPRTCNVNPQGRHGDYLVDLRKQLEHIGALVARNQIHYIVFCHGADSHQADDAGQGQCSTAEWLECSKIFYQWVQRMDQQRQQPLPLALALFGGYRADDYDSVIALHVADILTCANTLCGRDILFELQSAATNE